MDFVSEWFFIFFIYKSLWCFLQSFKLTGLSVQEKKQKIKFQGGSYGGHIGFLIGQFQLFYLQVTLMLPSKFQANWPFESGEEALFDQDTLMLPTKFQVNRPVSSGEEAKDRFSRWLPWISDQNILLFLIYKLPWCFLSTFKSTDLSVQEKKRKKEFHDGGHLGFLIRMIFAFFFFFYLQATPMLPTKLQVNWPIGSGEKVQSRFSRWWPSSIFDWKDFS